MASSAYANCLSTSDTSCTLQSHVINVYSTWVPNIVSSCSITIKLDNPVTFPAVNTSSITSTNFLCLIGSTFTYDFSTLVTTSSETLLNEVILILSTSASHRDFNTHEINLNSRTGMLTWVCRDILPDFDTVFSPMAPIPNPQYLCMFILFFNILY